MLNLYEIIPITVAPSILFFVAKIVKAKRNICLTHATEKGRKDHAHKDFSDAKFIDSKRSDALHSISAWIVNVQMLYIVSAKHCIYKHGEKTLQCF